MMKKLTLQIHNPHDIKKLRAITRIYLDLGPTEVDKGEDYLNLRFETDDIDEFWERLEPKIEDIKSQSIIVCEGEQGWDDYRTLHHFDPTEIS